MSEPLAGRQGADGRLGASAGTADARLASLQMDKRIDVIMGTLLRTGVLVAAAMVLVGGIVFLVRHRMPVTNYRRFEGEPSELRSLRGILREALAGHGRGLIQLGLVLLIATPVARVAFAVGAFFYERDWKYVAVSVLVLGLLFYSILSGHG
jgi:uncharacterized membrane protein